MIIHVYLNVPISRPTQLVTVAVCWTCGREEESCCSTTSLLCLMSPASKAAPASPTKAWDISIALILVCAGKRWEAVVVMFFCKKKKGKKDLMCVLTCCVRSLTGQSTGYLCGQCNREWERGQRLRLSIHCRSLWHQESERGLHPAFRYWWLTHRYRHRVLQMFIAVNERLWFIKHTLVVCDTL